MKLILTADVENLGVAGDIVEVRGGYGRNYLLPRGLAIVATRAAQEQVEEIKRAQEARAVRDVSHAHELRVALDGLEGVTVKVRTADSGKLFGSVTTSDIVEAVREAGGPIVDKRSIDLPKTLIKKTGNYQVQVNLHPEVKAKINFSVVSAS